MKRETIFISKRTYLKIKLEQLNFHKDLISEPLNKAWMSMPLL